MRKAARVWGWLKRTYWSHRFLSYMAVAMVWLPLSKWLIGTAVTGASLIAVRWVGLFVIAGATDLIWSLVDRRHPGQRRGQRS